MIGLYLNVLEAVRDTIRGLDLPGITDDAIQIVEQPAEPGIITYGVSISRDKERLTGGAPISMNQIGYPAVVTIQTGETKDAGDIEYDTDRRILIREAFQDKREPMFNNLVDTNVWILPCQVQFGPQNLGEYWEDNWSTNQMVIWCWFNEHRLGLCT